MKKVSKECKLAMVEKNAENKVCLLRIHDDIIKQLISSDKPNLRIRLCPSDPSNNMLLVNDEAYPLTRVKEIQSVDIAQFQFNITNNSRESVNPTVKIIGSVQEKFLVKQELVQSKQEQVRKQTEDAERARHQRRTISLDPEQPTSANKTMTKKRISNTSLGATNPTASKSVKRASSMTFAACTSEKIAKVSQDMLPSVAYSTSTDDKESVNSWSSLNNKDPPPALILNNSLPSSSRTSNSTRSLLFDRKPTTSSALLPPSTIKMGAKGDSYHRLEEEFGRRFQEYLILGKWIDQRHAIFIKLRTDLANGDEEQTMFRLVVEQKRLQEDTEYKQKLEKLEESYAALLMIKTRMKNLVQKN